MAGPVAALKSLTPAQRRSGLAAWLGWFFDGLDMHLYTLVATPYVALLMMLPASDERVGQHGAMINAAFLVGWALGGAFFGRIGDLMGRSRALILTILTYAGFTGLSACATEWWHLLIFRFLSALGIGGEWAVGASLLSETWPKSWRPWIAATLQTAVNAGILLACLAGEIFKHAEPRWIFLVGVFPALITLWIRRAVPESEEWSRARGKAERPPGVRDLFGPAVAGITWRVLAVCAVSLTAHWSFMYWQSVYIRKHPEVRGLSPQEQNSAAVVALTVLMVGSIIGNYFAALLAKKWGYRRAVIALLFCYGVSMTAAFSREWSHAEALVWFVAIGICQGVFGLFTMCLPPLFPVLLRTTGAGFCYNFGRIAAAGGTVFFGIFTTVTNTASALLYAGFLFLPAAIVATLMPEPPE